MTKSKTIVGAALLGVVVGLAIFLRPREAAREVLPAPEAIPAALVHVLRTKMGHHDLQMKALMSRVVLLDDDGVARAAGEIFDEPALARPVGGDELNGLLPERFFELQDELRASARRLVAASGRHDRQAVSTEFGTLAKTCVDCHEVYRRGGTRSDSVAGGAR